MESVTVLVAHPVASCRRLLLRLLSLAGYRALAVSSVEEAAAEMQVQVFAALVASLDFPDGQGEGLAVEYRRQHAFQHCPVILLTSDLHAVAPPCDQFFHEPFDADEFIQSVRDLLQLSAVDETWESAAD